MIDVIDTLLDALTGLQPAVLYLLTGLVVTLETSLLIGLLLPGDSVVLLAGTTVTGPSRFAAVVAVGTLGSLLGESIGYLLGRRYGERVRGSGVGRRLGEDAWAGAESFLTGRGGRAVAAARFVAVVHAVVPVVAGAVGMPYRRFLGWSALGAGRLVGHLRRCRRAGGGVVAAVRRAAGDGGPGRPRPGRARRLAAAVRQAPPPGSGVGAEPARRRGSPRPRAVPRPRPPGRSSHPTTLTRWSCRTLRASRDVHEDLGEPLRLRHVWAVSRRGLHRCHPQTFARRPRLGC
jgi:membrane-associated protein